MHLKTLLCQSGKSLVEFFQIINKVSSVVGWQDGQAKPDRPSLIEELEECVVILMI